MMPSANRFPNGGPLSFFYDHRLLLIRHGEAESNQRHAFLGRLDDPLTERGQEQANRLARLISEEPIHEIIASPLQRAAHTAAALAEVKGLAFSTHHGLIEQDFGAWDGLTFAEVKQRYSDNFKGYFKDGNNQAPINGENLQTVSERVWSFYQTLQWEQGKTIALVGHGCASQALLCRIMGIPTRGSWPFRLQNGSLTEVQFKYGQPSLTRLSWTG